MREESGGEWIHVYVWLSPFAVCSPEAITALFLNQLYPDIKYRAFFFFKGLVILGKDSHFRCNCHQVQQEFSHPHFLLTLSVAFDFGLEILHTCEFENGSFPASALDSVPCVLVTIEDDATPSPSSFGLAILWSVSNGSPRHLPSWPCSSQSVRKLVWVEGAKAVSSSVSMEAAYDP